MLVAAGIVVNHWRSVCRSSVLVAASRSPAGGLFLLAGATPAALGLLADMSERFPSDRGAIMGLYSVFLALGQIIGSLIGGFAADWLGIDGMFIATPGLLGIALVPLTAARPGTPAEQGPGDALAGGPAPGRARGSADRLMRYSAS